MKNNYLRVICALVFCTAISMPAFAQNATSLWTKISSKQQFGMPVNASASSTLTKSQHYKLNIDRLKSVLSNAPKRAANMSPSTVIVEFPNSQGSFDTYRIMEASIMEEALQNKYPNMRSYVGQGVKNPSSLIRFSVTPQGLNTLAFTDQGVELIDPNTDTDASNEYLVYNRRDVNRTHQDWTCEYIDDAEAITTFDENDLAFRNANDGTLRTFRLALACTVEYAQYHGGSLPSVMAAMINTMTRVNGIYEKELSITMVMVDNESIIYLGPDVSSDPYTNNNGSTMLGQNQTTIDAAIGSANYDIGHVFSTGGGGIAQLNSPCTSSGKARGVTGLPNPIGDAFAIDYVAHEMGHQFGSPHTFNGNAGANCLNQRTASTAYEPGSGSTIMGYAGICPPQNVQLTSDAYFHQISLQVIFENVTNGNSQCATLTTTGNSAPTSEAGPTYTIPKSTPYKLTGSSTDPDGIDSHTYTWEEFDLGPTGAPTETTANGPIVRSFTGTSNPVRYIPRLSDVVADGGVSTEWEKLASVSRLLNFKLTVRDNDALGGQTATDKMIAVVNSNAGPFKVTSQNETEISWTPGEQETITWDVAGTTGNGVNAANVNILLSTDGGINFDTVLASNVPNNGSRSITVPDVQAPFCRIMIEAVGNIFFNVNTVDFAIGTTVTTTCTTYSSAQNLGLDIPDGLGTTTAQQGPPRFSSIEIPDSNTISKITLTTDVSHPDTSEILIQFQHPDVSTNDAFVNVWVGSCSGNSLDITFDDSGEPLVCGSPTQGIFIPNSSLGDVFNGLDSQGTWNLAVVDFFVGNTGTINDWSIEICSTSLSVNESQLSDSFVMYPNPNNGEFTVKFKGASGNVDLEVFDIRGRSVFNNSYDSAGEFNQSINLGNVQSGMYLLNINTEAGKITKKLIVE